MKTSIRVLRYELSEVFHRSKILLILFFTIIIYETILAPVRGIIAETGLKTGILEPFVLICTKNIFTILIPLLYMVLISGFPYCKTNYFHLIRLSKKSWFCGELLFIAASSFLLIAILFLGSVLPLIDCVSPNGGWSDYMMNTNAAFPEIFTKRNTLFLDASVMSHGTPLNTALYSFMIMWGALIVTGLILLLGSVSGKRFISVIVICAVTFLGGGALYFKGCAKWFLPLAHTQFGLHFTGFYSRVKFPLAGSAIYMAILIIALIIACGIELKRLKCF